MMRGVVSDHPWHRWGWERLLDWGFQHNGAAPSYLEDAKAHCEVFPGEPSAHGYVGDALRRSGRPREARRRSGARSSSTRATSGADRARRPADPGGATRGRRGRCRRARADAAAAAAADQAALARSQDGARAGELRRAARRGGRPTTTCGGAAATRSSRPSEGRAARRLRSGARASRTRRMRPPRSGWSGSDPRRTGAAAMRCSRAWRRPGRSWTRRSRATCARCGGTASPAASSGSRKQQRVGAPLRRLRLELRRPRDLARRRPRAQSSRCRTGRSARRSPWALNGIAVSLRRLRRADEARASQPARAAAAGRPHHRLPPGAGRDRRRAQRQPRRGRGARSPASSRRTNRGVLRGAGARLARAAIMMRRSGRPGYDEARRLPRNPPTSPAQQPRPGALRRRTVDRVVREHRRLHRTALALPGSARHAGRATFGPRRASPHERWSHAFKPLDARGMGRAGRGPSPAADMRVVADEGWCRQDRGGWHECATLLRGPRDDARLGGTLAVDARPNGGIEVRGCDRDEVRLRVMIVATGPSDADARALAGQGRGRDVGGRARDRGPKRAGAAAGGRASSSTCRASRRSGCRPTTAGCTCRTWRATSSSTRSTADCTSTRWAATSTARR